MKNKGTVSFGSTVVGVTLILVVNVLIYFLTVAQFQKGGGAAVGGPADSSMVDSIKPAEEVVISRPEAAKVVVAAPVPAAPEPTTAAAAGSGDPMAVATARGCMACHQVAVKVLGPAYNDVAAKYKGDAAAFDMLVAKVKSGGSGTWGQIPMPPNGHVPEADIRTVVEWVLSL